MKEATVLVCTVGGSHQPILTAIKQNQPQFVQFLCTTRDPGTGRAGSDEQITGKGNVIEVRPPQPVSPSLPNIPRLAGLDDDKYEVELVSSDDVDSSFVKMQNKLRELKKRFPSARIIADYTGGTKSMTAALVLAALEEEIDLGLITGNRANLVQVSDGTQTGILPNVETIRLNRSMVPLLGCWQRHAYDEAARGLAALSNSKATALRTILWRARDLSDALAAWDRFDHAAALQWLDQYRPAIGAHFGDHLAALSTLKQQSQTQEPAHLFDLWRNAERRAVQGRYDDAVARCYRLLEWTAQWLLRRDLHLETSNIPADAVPPEMTLMPDQEGRRQAGLVGAWGLVRYKLQCPAAAFAQTQERKMLDLIQARNQSILAHGFTPVDRSRWQAWHAWMEEEFNPMLLREAAKSGLRRVPPQLPRELPSELLMS